MATKRTQRIDPNAAFNAIVGISPEPQETPVLKSGEGEGGMPAPAQNKVEPAQENRGGESAPAAPAKKLVQKGYYLTEEQVKQLGITAVMKGVDRSSIVRDALDLYFEAQQDKQI